MNSRLAIVAKSFDKYSETFIRNHAERISPTDTFLIAVNSCAVFLKSISVCRCLSVAPSQPFFSRTINSLYRFVIGGSVYALGRINRNRIAAFLIENDVECVLAEYGPVGCAVASACRKANVKLYVHFHGYDASRLIKNCHIRYSYKRLAKSSAGFIFPSKFLANQLKDIGINSTKFHIAPCCVDVNDFSFSAEQDQNLLLSVGRFVPKKAPDKTIRAFAKVLRKYPDLKLEMIGDGDLLPMCKDLVKALEIEQSVVFHGSREHDFIKCRLAKAKLFLQHSVTAPDGDTEGLGVSVLEAMSTGAVVVATRHNGFVETVVEGETGFLVNEHDVNGMAQCCVRLLRNEKLLVSMRQKARQRVEQKFTVEQQMMTLREIMGIKNVC